MKTALVASALAVLLSVAPARAEVIDIATIKCSDLATMSEEEASYLMIWLHGYFGGQANDTTMDLDGMGAAGKAIGEYCAANPSVGVLTAVQQTSDGQ